MITNRHVVTGRHQHTNKPLSDTAGVPDSLRVIHNCSAGLGLWTPRDEPLYSGEQPRWREHPLLGAKADFVALPITSDLGLTIKAYDPAQPGPLVQCLRPAHPVSVVGFPFGMTVGGYFPVYATGFIATDPDVDFNGLPLFLIDCRARPGQSGAPVIFFAGSGGTFTMESPPNQFWQQTFMDPVTRLLGIYSGRVNEQSDLGFVWKVSAIAELVATL